MLDYIYKSEKNITTRKQMKINFVEIETITSTKTKTGFSADKIETLAKEILETGGLVRPLVIKKVGFERYEVIAGHLEYHAAVAAQDQDKHTSEVAAVIIEDDKVEAAQRQLATIEGQAPQPTKTPALRVVKAAKDDAAKPDILKNINVLTFPEPTRTLEEVQQERNAKYITPVTTKHQPITPEAATLLEEAEVTVEPQPEATKITTTPKPLEHLLEAVMQNNYRAMQKALKECRQAGLLITKVRLNATKATLTAAANEILKAHS